MSVPLDRLLAAAPGTGVTIGRSREGRPIPGHRFGSGPVRVSLLAGCHADEPVGPRLLAAVCGWLAGLPADHPALRRAEWWIVPHANPDGAARNRAWQPPDVESYDPIAHLAHAVREEPGDDLEFGFPVDAGDEGARPEARAIRRWWASAGGPFALHASLHGMAFAAGPWFLLEPAWVDRTAPLRERCRDRVRALGHVLHDVDRRGEKGFHRIERGFATRPDSRAMRTYFRERGDSRTAARFRPSSMETIRSFGGDPLTLVPEIPLFITPGVGERIGPPDPALETWRERITAWRLRLARPGAESEVRAEMGVAGLASMAVRDQLDLQWTFLRAGLASVGLDPAP